MKLKDIEIKYMLKESGVSSDHGSLELGLCLDNGYTLTQTFRQGCSVDELLDNLVSLMETIKLASINLVPKKIIMVCGSYADFLAICKVNNIDAKGSNILFIDDVDKLKGLTFWSSQLKYSTMNKDIIKNPNINIFEHTFKTESLVKLNQIKKFLNLKGLIK